MLAVSESMITWKISSMPRKPKEENDLGNLPTTEEVRRTGKASQIPWNTFHQKLETPVEKVPGTGVVNEYLVHYLQSEVK